MYIIMFHWWVAHLFILKVGREEVAKLLGFRTGEIRSQLPE